MSWHPISLADLQAMLARDLSECSVDQREFYRRASIAPANGPCHDCKASRELGSGHRNRLPMCKVPPNKPLQPTGFAGGCGKTLDGSV
jgi:hypothetical protein